MMMTQRRSLPFLQLLAFVLLSTSSLVLSSDTTTTTGKPHSTVQVLTEKNFDDALNDPANGLWLLKFYGEYDEYKFQ
jgi:hypothetical protein